MSSLKKGRPPLATLAVSGLMAFSFLLNFLKIGREGFGDKYYAAAVKSMLSSWHNFFFASFDPGGFVTVDKPAPGLWIQTLSAAIFGFKGWALILPQAIAGALSVGILYVIVRRAYGVTAGLLASLVLAITPIFVAVNRTNQLDSLLLTTLLLATLAVMVAAERSELKWFLAGMALVGLGFNVKMFAAYTVLPALLVPYFLGSRSSLGKRTGHLAAGLAVLAAVSLSWALLVDLTPKDKRPYVGGSKNDSVLELAVDYNGINRLIPQWLRRGRFGFFRGGRPPAGSAGDADRDLSKATLPAGAPQGPGFQIGPPGTGGGGPFGFETGRAGILRLFNRQLAGQTSWLIVFGLIGAAVAASGMKRPFFRNRRSRSVLLWGVWFLTLAVYFSTAGFFHRYYLNLIAPAIAALCGISAVEMWERYRQKGTRGWILPPAILGAAASQLLILAPYPDWGRALAPVIAAAAGLAFFTLIALRIGAPSKKTLAAVAVGLGLAGLLAAPAYWSVSASVRGVAASMPAAGPDQGRGPAMRFGGGANGPAAGWFNREIGTKKLVAFLTVNRQAEKFLLAVPSARLAWDIIIETGDPVMAMGGFMGGDRILTVARLEELVEKGEVRYFLVRRIPDLGPRFGPPPGARAGMGGAFGEEGALQDLTRWIEKNGTLIPDEVWKEDVDLAREAAPLVASLFFPGLPPFPMRAMIGSLKLYDLKPGSATTPSRPPRR